MELNSDIHIVMHSLCFKNQMWQVKSMPPQWIKSIYSFYHVTFNSHFLYAFPISLLFVYCIYGFRRCSSWPPELRASRWPVGDVPLYTGSLPNLHSMVHIYPCRAAGIYRLLWVTRKVLRVFSMQNMFMSKSRVEISEAY